MAEHHAIDFQTKLALLTEANTLMGYILSSSGGGAHATTIQAVRDFLVQFYGEGIPWIRIYHEFPDWQKQCGLFDKEWDRDAVLEKTIVFLTMISPHKARASIMREALGGGTWKSTGAKTIGEGSLNEFVLTNLYHKGVGITVKEFHLKMDQKPRVAICVLHGKDYRHLIRDLREYIHEGRFPGQIQANPQVNSAPVGKLMNGPDFDQTINQTSDNEGYFRGANQGNQQMVQRLGPINSAPVVGGLMIGSDFDQTISLTSENEANYGQLPSFFRSEIPPPVAQYVLPVDQFSGAVDQFSEHNHLMERYYQGPPLENSLMRTLSNDTTMTGYDHASRGIPVSSLSNTQYMNENLYDTTVLPEQDAPSNQMSMQNESSISLIGNSVGTLDWNAMINGAFLDPLPPTESDWAATASTYPGDGYGSVPYFF